MKRLIALMLGAAVLLGFQPAPASAENYVSYVSNAGSDNNNCTITSPCATFNQAVNQTVGGGEINCLDSGNFIGSILTIDKALTIKCVGVVAGVQVFNSESGAIITIAAGTSDDVHLIGLDIVLANSSLSGATYGVNIFRAGNVFIENCRIKGWTAGVEVNASGSSGGPITVFIRNTEIAMSGTAVEVTEVNGQYAVVILDNDALSQFSLGVGVTGPYAFVAINNSTIASSGGTGIATAQGGTILSWGNNRVVAPTNGQPNYTLSLE